MPVISFDRAVEYYDETRGFVPGVDEKIRDSILDYTHASPAYRFLELGIGTGRIALPFIEAGYTFDGADISLAMMGRLEQKLAASATAHSKTRQEYHCGLVQNNITQTLPFRADIYNVIILVHVLHLVDEWQAVLTEARRVLVPKGSWLLISSTGRRRSTDPDPSQATREANPLHPNRLVHQRWNEILRDLGMDVERLNFRRQHDQEFQDYLEGMGAQVEIVDLGEYEQPPLSPRMIADRLKARMHSAEWLLPDDVHTEASRRLEQWLKVDCPEPDVAIVGKAPFKMLSAHWAE